MARHQKQPPVQRVVLTKQERKEMRDALRSMRPSAIDRVEIKGAVEVAEILWPRFIQERSATFLEFQHRRRHLQRPRVETPAEREDAELWVNRLQVLRFGLRHATELRRSPWWRRGHPDFAAACRLAELLGEAWAAKLAREFPKKEFRIIVSREQQPAVTFHEVRTPKGAPSVEKNPPGALLVIHSRSGERAGSIRPPARGEPPPTPARGVYGSFTLARVPVRFTEARGGGQNRPSRRTSRRS